MNITVYLPDQIGDKAKEAGINFSATLRNAVEQEIERMEGLAKHQNGMAEIRVEICDEDGDYFGTFTGELLAEAGEVSVYLDDRGRVRIYDEALTSLDTHDDLDDQALEELLAQLLQDRQEFLEVMGKLGIKPTIEI